MSVSDLGQKTNAEVLASFLQLSGKNVVDIGCGSLQFSRIVAEQGAKVLAIDPDTRQAEENRTLPPTHNIEFVECDAKSLPVEDLSLDGVFFAYSLHHIPQSDYSDVFAEVMRVTKPGGFLYVIEPADCPLNEVMRLFHNEDTERAAAQEAIDQLGSPAFQKMTKVKYHNYTQYGSFDEFAENFGNRTFNPGYTMEDVRSSEVEAAFHKLGGQEHRFEGTKQVAFLQGKK